MFDRSNRLDATGQLKKDHSNLAVNYLSFSDFIRQQFLQSRNVFSTTQDRPSSSSMTKVEQALHETYLAKRVADSNGKKVNDSDRLMIDTGVFSGEPQTHDDVVNSPLRPKKKFQKKRVKTNQSQVVVDGKPTDTSNSKYLRGAELHPPMPGPGAYFTPTNMLKPSFNRTYTEPEPVVHKSQPSYLRHTSASASAANFTDGIPSVKKQHVASTSDERVEYRPKSTLDNVAEKHRETAEMWQQYKGAFLNKTKYRLKSAPPSTKRGSQSASMAGPLLDDAFPLTFRVKENNFLEVKEDTVLFPARKAAPKTKTSQESERLYGVRYPPISDDIIQRWESVQHSSYQASPDRRPLGAMRLISGKPSNKIKKGHNC